MINGKKIIGVVAEFNPFHDGHIFLLNKIYDIFKDYYLVVVLSGNYVQRGEPACYSKQKRLENILDCKKLLHKPDLIVELPNYCSLSPASDYAYYAIKYLNILNIDYLAFGCDLADSKLLLNISDFIHSQAFKENIEFKNKLASGEKFAKVFSDILISNKVINAPLNSNDILGLEYIKAIGEINPNVKIYPIKRDNNFTSATKIRAGLEDILTTNNYSKILNYRLNNPNITDFSIFNGVGGDLSNRILNLRPYYDSFNDTVLKLKSKNSSYASISRAMFSVILNLKKENISALKLKTPSFIRLLYLNTENEGASILLKNLSIPIVNLVKDVKKYELLSDYTYKTMEWGDNIYKSLEV